MIGGICLMLLLVMWLIPLETIPLNPEPSELMTLSDAVAGIDLGNEHDLEEINSKEDYVKRVEVSPALKTVTDRVVSAGCGSEKICQAKAAYYFVRDELNYVNDPNAYEYVKGPLESLQSTAGDCDDASVLLASMLNSIGVKTRFVFMPGHVYIEADIPEAPQRYKQPSGWIVLDGTCSNCEFGEMAMAYAGSEKQYI